MELNGKRTEGDGYKINGLTFTGVSWNGRTVVISDQLPVKSKDGHEVHCFPMEERDQLDGYVLHTLVVSQKMYDAVMSDGEIEKYRLERAQ